MQKSSGLKARDVPARGEASNASEAPGIHAICDKACKAVTPCAKSFEFRILVPAKLGEAGSIFEFSISSYCAGAVARFVAGVALAAAAVFFFTGPLSIAISSDTVTNLYPFASSVSNTSGIASTVCE
jgi:hypothetical protein